MRLKQIIFAIAFISFHYLHAETYYIDTYKGNDQNQGTKEMPLKTLNEAANRINTNNDITSTEIILSKGVYFLTNTVLFERNKFTKDQRLIIRAETLPDEPEWNPQLMPEIFTAVPLHAGISGEEAIGIKVEVSHVTIEGIRFSGSPDFSYKSDNELRRTYPIWRGGKNLEDLLVTQCLFTGDADVLPLHVGVIANGSNLVIDHCVFYNCKNPVVFWKSENGNSINNAMRYCLVYGSYFSGVWTTSDINEDFQFNHNIIANCKNAWIREKGSKKHYTAKQCIFTQNQNFSGYGSGPLGNYSSNEDNFLKMDDAITTGNIQIDKDQSHKSYLQLIPNTFGTNIKAGLFH